MTIPALRRNIQLSIVKAIGRYPCNYFSQVIGASEGVLTHL